jgi:hypothetical protein
VLNREFNFDKLLILFVAILVVKFNELQTLIWNEIHQQIEKAKRHLLDQCAHTLSFLDRLLLFELSTHLEE